MTDEYLWYIPNQVRPGHRGDDVVEDHNSLATLVAHAEDLERYGWGGALLGTADSSEQATRSRDDHPSTG